MEFGGGQVHRALGRIVQVLVLATVFVGIAASQEATDSADVLTVDQAVKLALANNRNLKSVSLGLDSSKQKLDAEKTRRLPAFNTYVFASQLLQPINFTVQAGSLEPIPASGRFPPPTRISLPRASPPPPSPPPRHSHC